MVCVSAFQVMRRSGGAPCFAQLASKRSWTCGLGQSKRSMPSAVSPGASAWQSAMKKRPSKVPNSATEPVMPNSPWMRMRPAQTAAAKRDDMPGTVSYPVVEVVVHGGDAGADGGAGLDGGVGHGGEM